MSRPHPPRRQLADIPMYVGGVHHWDENGRAELSEEPSQIQMIHEEIIGFVTSWLDDWEAERTARVQH